MAKKYLFPKGEKSSICKHEKKYFTLKTKSNSTLKPNGKRNSHFQKQIFQNGKNFAISNGY